MVLKYLHVAARAPITFQPDQTQMGKASRAFHHPGKEGWHRVVDRQTLIRQPLRGGGEALAAQIEWEDRRAIQERTEDARDATAEIRAL